VQLPLHKSSSASRPECHGRHGCILLVPLRSHFVQLLLLLTLSEEATENDSSLDTGVLDVSSKKRSKEELSPNDDSHYLQNPRRQSRNYNSQTVDPKTSTSTTTMAALDTTITPDQIKGLRLQAIFHPKFDNEKQKFPTSDNNNYTGCGSSCKSIRETMMEREHLDIGRYH
jgi:hypothetical protein